VVHVTQSFREPIIEQKPDISKYPNGNRQDQKLPEKVAE